MGNASKRGSSGWRWLLILLGLSAAAELSPAAPPSQFSVWGSAGVEFPAVPEGYSETPAVASSQLPTVPGPEESARGFLIFACDPFPSTPSASPIAAERAGRLSLTAALGEYEPASFVIFALETLNGLTASVGGLRSTSGRIIPSDCVDVRFARAVRVRNKAGAKTYRMEPFLPEKRESVSIPKGQSAQVWLTLKVPENAAAGEYAGTVTVGSSDRKQAQLPLCLRVLPFALPAPPIEMTMFYPRPPSDDASLIAQLTDMREHGCTGFESPLGAEVKSRDGVFGEDDVAATRARCKRLMDASNKVFGPRRAPVTFGVGHQIAYYWDHRKNWFSFWPHGRKIEDDLFKAIDLVRSLAREEGWPPPRVYALDEAAAHGLLDEAVYYYGLIKRRRPGLETWTTIGGGMAMGLDEIGQLNGCIDVFSSNRFTPEIAAAFVARNKPYHIYNGCGNSPEGARFFFGFWGWKTGAERIAQWAYHFGNAVFDGDGFRQDDEGFVYIAPDGPLPSLMWEAVREGIDDYRYVHLLRQRIASAKASASDDARAAAADAEKTLLAVLGRIEWGFQALDHGNRTPPPLSSTLSRWRGEIAGQIERLEPYAGKATEPGRPSPLELPWATPARRNESYGVELLPRSDFERDMKPWRVEAWKGKGQGALDTAAGHAGKGSARIEVPAAGGNEAVTVLVWPSWGDGGLNLSLSGGRAYDFSAWVKCKDRSMPPGARVALPGSAQASSRTGAEKPDADGWRRVWVRVELARPAVPKYLAVWIQGPGTVWVDDLSLREVIASHDRGMRE